MIIQLGKISTFYVLERYIEPENAVKTIVLFNVDIPQLTTEEWTIVHQSVEVLKPFELTTKNLSSEKYFTAPLVIPLTNGLINTCKELVQQNYEPEVKCVMDKLLKGMMERFGNVELSTTSLITTILDPMFKT